MKNRDNLASPDGPGTRLHNALKAWGFKERKGCGCLKYVKEMNVRGPRWVRDNLPTVIGWLRKSARERNLPFSGWVAKQFILYAVADYERGNNMKRDFFKRVYCVNLFRRTNRWKRFQKGLPKDWPFRPVQRFKAVDKKKVPTPKGWKGGAGAWGCYRSHLHLIERALNDGVDSILLFEDDAIFCEDFTQKVTEYLDAIPEGQGLIYLGGQHQYMNKQPPTKIGNSGLVFQPFDVNRTHAFGIRGRELMKKIYLHLMQPFTSWHGPHHIDHWLGKLHQKREDPIYTPARWLVGQEEGRSDVGGNRKKKNFWTPGEVLSRRADVDFYPFIAILGLHSSGSSMVAGMVNQLGIHLGNQFIQGPPNNRKTGSFEAVGLAKLAEWAIPLWSTDLAVKKGQLWSKLKAFINEKRREALKKRTTAGGKYPQLCRMGPQLQNIVGDKLFVIDVDRPLEDSVKSLHARFKGREPIEKVRRHQQWLLDGKRELMDAIPEERKLVVNYRETIDNPEDTVQRLVDFLGLNPGDLRIKKAIELVRPELCHVQGEQS